MDASETRLLSGVVWMQSWRGKGTGHACRMVTDLTRRLKVPVEWPGAARPPYEHVFWIPGGGFTNLSDACPICRGGGPSACCWSQRGTGLCKDC